jgi:pyruvate dehydrogenase E2 component (dihydrolipoamide acetyltransferase)
MGLCAAPTLTRAPSPRSLPELAREFAAELAAPASAAPASAPTPAAPAHDEAANPYVDLPVTNIRKVIAARLLESKTTNPHEYISADVSLAGVAALRAELKAAGVRASVNDCVVYAAGP